MNRRFIRAGGIITGVLALWLIGISMSIYRFGYTDYASASDCTIVLGAAVDGASPSPVFKERIDHAISLYQDDTVQRIIFTGGMGDEQSHSEASVAAIYATGKGVSPDHILIEEQSRTTRQNLVEARELMVKNGLESAIIVSDPLHLRRAQAMANSLKIKAVTSPTPTTRYQSVRTKAPFLMREVYFLHHFWVFRR